MSRKINNQDAIKKTYLCQLSNLIGISITTQGNNVAKPIFCDILIK